jgi:hypothetical protein
MDRWPASDDRPPAAAWGVSQVEQTTLEQKLTKNHGNGRAIGVLIPVFAGALVLTFTVMQARTSTAHAPGSVVRRDGFYAVRLSGTFDDSPPTFTARLTGPQVVALTAASGVVSVSRLLADATLAPTPSDCDPVAVPAAPATAPVPVPAPSPLPAPSPPTEDGVAVPDRRQAAQIPSRAATRTRVGAAVGPEKKAAASSSGGTRVHGRPGGKGTNDGPATSKSPASRVALPAR